LVFGDVFSFSLEFFRFNYALRIPLFYFALALGVLAILFLGGLLFSNVILHTPLSHHFLLPLLYRIPLGFLLLSLERLLLLLVFLVRGAIPFPLCVSRLLPIIPLRYLFFYQLVFDHLFDFFLLFGLDPLQFLHFLLYHRALRSRTATIESASHSRRRFEADRALHLCL
jgi:hypothetical protein